MAKQVQLRRGTTTQISSFTGAAGELTVDTESNTIYVHDGLTPGGHKLVTNTQLGNTRIQDLSGISGLTLDAGKGLVWNGTAWVANEVKVRQEEVVYNEMAPENYTEMLDTVFVPWKNTPTEGNSGHIYRYFTVTPGGSTDQYKVTINAREARNQVVYTDATNTIIGSEYIGNDYMSIWYTDQPLTVPATATTVHVTSFGTAPVIKVKATRDANATTGDINQSAAIITRNDNSFLKGKTIHYMGTSIPTYSGYVEMAARALGAANCINKSIGASSLRRAKADGSISGLNWYQFIRLMTYTNAEKQAILDNWETTYQPILGGGAPTTLTTKEQGFLLNSGYETVLMPYLDGTYPMPDIFIIDHAHNDREGFGDTYEQFTTEPATRNDRNYFQGALNWIIDLIREHNHNARILMVGHHTYDKGFNDTTWLCDSQANYAAANGIPLLKLWEKTGMNTQPVTGTQALYSQTPWSTYATAGSPDTNADMPYQRLIIPDTVHPYTNPDWTFRRTLGRLVTQFIRENA